MGHQNPPATRPSETVATDQADIRIEALHIARSLPDAHSTAAVIENAGQIRDWIVAGRRA